MTPNKKAVPVATGTASNTAHIECNHSIRARLKAAIVRLTLWGLLPFSLAYWLIQRGGLRHE
jgi:hypothetical protein